MASLAWSKISSTKTGGIVPERTSSSRAPDLSRDDAFRREPPERGAGQQGEATGAITRRVSRTRSVHPSTIDPVVRDQASSPETTPTTGVQLRGPEGAERPRASSAATAELASNHRFHDSVLDVQEIVLGRVVLTAGRHHSLC
jgi:hypothetical protein